MRAQLRAEIAPKGTISVSTMLAPAALYQVGVLIRTRFARSRTDPTY
jgi:hypothetical protein